MLNWLLYWYEEKRKLRRQMQFLAQSRWERRNLPAFRRRSNRWPMVKTF